MNTMFQKPNVKLLSWKFPSSQAGGPWERPKYETLDYVCTMADGRTACKTVKQISDVRSVARKKAFFRSVWR